ncbi:MAG TPA: Crp/Fnr family transcriptional regulator [Pelobium sp.]
MCNNCVQEWLLAIEANRFIYEIKKGESIFKEGDKVEGIYFVYAGNVKVHKKWGSKELILRFATEGTILGHRGISSHNNTYPISATALENSTVAFISLDFFNTTIKINPDFTYRLMLFFADELQESELKMRDIAHISVKARLANALLFFEKKFGTDENDVLRIELSKQDFAAFIGTTYETVSRMLSELTAEKAVQVSKRKIKILSLEKLEALAKNED